MPKPPPYYRQALAHSLQQPITEALQELTEIVRRPDFVSLRVTPDTSRLAILAPKVVDYCTPRISVAIHTLACGCLTKLASDEVLATWLRSGDAPPIVLSTRWKTPDLRHTYTFGYATPFTVADRYDHFWQSQRTLVFVSFDLTLLAWHTWNNRAHVSLDLHYR